MEKSLFIQEYEKLMKDISNRDIFASTTDNDKTEQEASLRDLLENNSMPLYRFRKFTNYSVQSFRDDTIYHSYPHDFNDPHDCLFYIDENKCEELVDRTIPLEKFINLSAKDVLNAFHTEYPMFSFIQDYSDEDHASAIAKSRNFLNNMKTSFKKSNMDFLTFGRNEPKISCYSEDIYSTLMWAHYADYHKGFALEYDFKGIYEGNSKVAVLPVIYGNERFDATKMAIFSFLFDSFYEDKKSKYTIIEILSFFNLYIYKGLEWQYEREWRSFLIDNDNMFFSMNPKAVYLGVHISDEHGMEIKEIAIEKGIPVYKMYIDFNQKEYKLSMEKL